MSLSDLVHKFRQIINPPYSQRNLILICATLLILLLIPITVIYTLQQRDLRSKANVTAVPAAKHIGLGGGGFEIDTLISIGSTQKRLFETVECGGIRVSDDEGATWKEASKGIPVLGDIQNLWKDPYHADIIFVGQKGNILRSTDNGSSWITVRSQSGVPFADFAAKDASAYFAVEGNRRTMFGDPAGIGGSGSTAKIWKSTNGGGTWTVGNQVAVTSNDDLPSIYLHPTTKVLYAAASTGGVRKSADDGVTWTNFNNGLTNLFSVRLVSSPLNSNILYLTTKSDTATAKTSEIFTFNLSDASPSWLKITYNLPSNRELVDIALDATGAVFVTNWKEANYDGGIYKFASGSSSWQHLTRMGTKPSPNMGSTPETGWVQDISFVKMKSAAISIDPQDNNKIYFTNPFHDQIFKTTDGGANWRQIYSNQTNPTETDPTKKKWTNRGTTLVGAHALAVDPANPNKIFIGYGDWATALSEDGGNSWRIVATLIPTGQDINKILFDPTDSQNICIVTGYRATPADKFGVYYSSNGGNNWTLVGGGTGNVNSLPGGWGLDIDIDPTTTAGSRDVYIVVEGQGVYWQIGQTGNWSRLDLLGGLPNTQDAANWPLRTIGFDQGGGGRPKAIYVGFEKTGTGTGGIYKSTNSGSGWSAWSQITASNGKSISRGMDVNPNTGDLYFGAGNPSGGAYRLQYGSSSLELLVADDKIQGLSIVFGLTRDKDIVYISGQKQAPLGKWEHGIFTSLMDRLPAEVFIRGQGILYDANSDTLYTARQCAGVYKIEDVNPEVPDSQAPSTPTGLVAAAVAYNQISLDLMASSDNIGVVGYRIVRDSVTIASSTTNSFVDNTVSASTTYNYQVIAYDAAGNNSAHSNTAIVTTPAVPDTQTPSVNITSPNNGQTVSDTTTIAATASDNVGVTRVEFYVDGSLKGTDTSLPYSYSWGTTIVVNGPYTLTAKAYDAAGNEGTSHPVNVTVNNTLPPEPTVDIKADNSDGPITINYNTATTLSWDSGNTASCTASGDWSGTKATSGSEANNNLTSSKIYTLTCTGPGGLATDNVVVNVSAPPVCEILSASWNTSTTTEGSVVNLNITGSVPCNDKQISFEVKENDSILEGIGDDPVNNNPANTTFIGTNAVGTWIRSEEH